VIGAGPAGLMAAGLAAEAGASVVLLEKNDQPGLKLLLTGKGRCNITVAEENLADFIAAFGQSGKFLYSALHQFNLEDTIGFFENLGVPTKVERGKRVFPVSDQAADVLAALLSFVKKQPVELIQGGQAQKIIKSKNRITKLFTTKGEILADKYILATGGLSYSATGSTGDGLIWANELGHTVIEPKPALTPIKCRETWIKETKGLSLRNTLISVYQNNKKQAERFGEALFTDDGMSGPIILDLAKKIGQLLATGEVELRLDLKPTLDYPQLDDRLQRDFKKYSNSMFKNSLDDLLPQSLVPVFIKLSGLDPTKAVNSVTKEERKRLLHLFKELKVHATGLEGFNKAVITSGGVSLKEIEPKTMRSKLINNLYFAGEILDLDGPTGGYNLQVCWSTGYVAGKSAAL